MRQRLLFADQLGPHFDDGGPLLMVESVAAFRRRPTHRQKAHLVLSAMRHRAAELGDRLEVVQAETFRDALAGRDLEVVGPTSHAARALADELGAEVLPSRGFVTTEADFAEWAGDTAPERLLMDRFYRWVREREGILMEGDRPAGGRFNHDQDNREPPPKGVTTLGLQRPPAVREDDVDEQVRDDLDRMERDHGVRFIGRDGPRLFPATRRQALAALRAFVDDRLPHFGPHEDASLRDDPVMAHSLLSTSMNLGLLDSREVVEAAVDAYESGDVPVASAEGFVRQVIGWRDWVWHLYWHLGPGYLRRNHLRARAPLPDAYWDLDGSTVEAACLSHVLDDVGRRGWAHHIQRLMVLGSFSLQRDHRPAELNEWFTGAFVDGTPWVMPANVIGMSQHADGGIVATKPYTSGGAYIHRMSDFCGDCAFDPRKRLGDDACPFTAGYWAFLHRHEDALAGNHRMKQPLAGMRRLADLDAVVEQERHRQRF